ncbi:MAG TPA: radical SAM protein [Thermodesulfobacteriota bacterium]|nr:radical SAM protein [Thermodesulfobacteriota bacterium]
MQRASTELESDKVISRQRKGKVLTPAQFGCLKGIPTLNITNGCLFQCTYCYARGYRQAPPQGEVYLYVNLPNLLKEELEKKKVLPQWAILNTASDCFQPHPDILNATYEVIQILIDHGVGISFLTKGSIPHRFFSLFKRSPDKILAQIGVVSFSERYWREYEPGTPFPEERLENVQRLKEIGIVPEVRIDPIIPFVTDTEIGATALFRRLREIGMKRVTLSYLHLRPAIQKQLMTELCPLHRKMMESCFGIQEWKTIGSSAKTKLLPKTVREKGYQRMRGIAERFGITASVCQCKNPDLKGDLCGSGRVKAVLGKKALAQLPLFRC